MKTYSDFKPFSKDQAYWERNQLVAALSKLFPSTLGRHDENDKDWDDDWRWIVYVNVPSAWYHMMPMSSPLPRIRQLSWHIHKEDLDYFAHLPVDINVKWDGHSTDEKYERLANLWIEEPKKWWQFWK